MTQLVVKKKKVESAWDGGNTLKSALPTNTPLMTPPGGQPKKCAPCCLFSEPCPLLPLTLTLTRVCSQKWLLCVSKSGALAQFWAPVALCAASAAPLPCRWPACGASGQPASTARGFWTSPEVIRSKTSRKIYHGGQRKMFGRMRNSPGPRPATK